jgi:hypothetical protein
MATPVERRGETSPVILRSQTCETTATAKSEFRINLGRGDPFSYFHCDVRDFMDTFLLEKRIGRDG